MSYIQKALILLVLALFAVYGGAYIAHFKTEEWWFFPTMVISLITTIASAATAVVCLCEWHDEKEAQKNPRD